MTCTFCSLPLDDCQCDDDWQATKDHTADPGTEAGFRAMLTAFFLRGEARVTIPIGMCQCGCGQQTKLASRTDTKQGHRKGQPLRFIRGHQTKGKIGLLNSSWKGGKIVNDQGYVLIRLFGHPRADVSGRVREHILIVEKALGKPLPLEAMVHHLDENRANNKNNNLVICPNDAYHHLLHMRLRAKKACGNLTYRKCEFCHQWDNPEKMRGRKNRPAYYHAECRNTYRRRQYAEQKLA